MSRKKTDEQPSSKTPHVMRLVEQKKDSINPVIVAGKSMIPRKLRGIEPLTKVMRRESGRIGIDGTEDEELVTVNLTALVIEDNAEEILRRFNACDCEVCVERLSQLTAESVVSRFAKIGRHDAERRSERLKELMEPLKKSVTSQMIRIIMHNKKRSFHD